MSSFSRDNYRVEPLPPSGRYRDQEAEAPWHHAKRARLFALVFGLTLAIGLLWTLLQPAVYRAGATVLMTAPSAIDAVVNEANLQNVAIQRRILLGEEITQRLQVELARTHAIDIEPDSLRDLLRVEPVPETNLVEMAAQGSEGELFPTVVNTWIDVYMEARAEDIEQSKDHTLGVVQDELDGLAIKLEQARDALEQYRVENDIISAERQENEVLARLDGFNEALNNAIEEEVKTRAYLDTLQMALRRGEMVVPQDERQALEGLETELRQLQAEMTELNKRYTIDYINKQPQLRAVPERIEELKSDLAKALSRGRETELAAAQQAHTAAGQTVRDLEAKLEEHKRRVSEFNRIYATHQALADDLGRLEELNRETQARLVQVQVRQVEKYPQVSVIERPARESERIGPDYLLLLGGTLGAAFGLGVLSVWLHGFLGHQNTQPAQVTLSGVHLYPQEVSGQLAYSTEPDPRLGQATSTLLGNESSDREPETDRDNGESNGTGSGKSPDHGEGRAV